METIQEIGFHALSLIKLLKLNDCVYVMTQVDN